MRKKKEFEQFQKLYKEGLNDQLIANEISVSSETVRKWRKKLNLPSNFSYDEFKAIDYNKVNELVMKELTDSEIAKELNTTKSSIYAIRKKLNIKRRPLNKNKHIEFTQEQKEILFGCLIGDGFMRIGAGVNPRFKCSHSLVQKEYNEYKASFFGKHAKLSEYTRLTPDKRNGICYSESVFRIGANSALKELYEMFYVGEKQIPIEHLEEYYSPLAMAIHFMDDGTKETHGYSIATMCFSRDNIERFCDFLLQKYEIKTSIHKSKNVYIRAESREKFTKLISPYVCESMQYKLHKIVT